MRETQSMLFCSSPRWGFFYGPETGAAADAIVSSSRFGEKRDSSLAFCQSGVLENTCSE
jgi:hypothetical protein